MFPLIKRTICVDTRETGDYFSLRYLWLLEPDNLRKVNEQGWGVGGLGESSHLKFNMSRSCTVSVPPLYVSIFNEIL